MNCFIHPHKAAVATCKRCGKAMCENCSAYSGHSGECPECRNADYKRERAALIDERKSKIRWTVFEAVICALIVVFTLAMIFEMGAEALIALVLALIPVPFIVRNAKRLKAIKERLTFVEGEIAKLDAALGRGVAEI